MHHSTDIDDDLKKTLREHAVGPTKKISIEKIAGDVSEDMQDLHELKVHQFELELQNEKLRRVSAELDESREEFFQLFNLAPVGYLVLDNISIILRANDTFCQMVGKEMDHVIGRPFSEFVSSEDHDNFLALYRAFYKNPGKNSIEARIVGNEQKTIFARMEGRLVRLGMLSMTEETDRRLLLTVSDITAQKTAEELNKKNEARLQGLLNIAQFPSNNSGELLDYCLEQAISLTSSKIGYIYYYDELSQLFTLNTWSKSVMEKCGVIEKQTVYELNNTGIWGEAVRQRRPIIVNDFQSPNILKKGYPLGHVELTHFMTIPLLSEESIVAVVGVGNKDSDYDDADVRELTLLMDSAWKIVEKQKADNALRESEERFRQLAENIKEVFWLRDRKTGRMDYISPSYEKVWGKTCESLYKRPQSFMESVHPLDREEVIKRQRNLSENGVNFDYEYRIVRPDGEIRWIWARTYPVQTEAGQIIRYAGIAEDITPRRQSDDLIRESKECYQSLFSQMQEGFALHEIILGEDGKPVDYRYLDLNPAFEKLTGIKREEAIGKTVREILPNIESQWIERYGEVATTGTPVYFMDVAEELGRYYEVTAYSPKKNQFAVIFSDVSNRMKNDVEKGKLISELEHKNSELEQFTYTVSHDLKSPLITIKGFLGLLEGDYAARDEERIRSDITRIGSAADKMKLLLDDLLELSRIGRIANPPTRFAFNEAATEAAEILSGGISARNVKLEIQPDMPTVYGDRARIIEVLQNLIENAVKYSGNQPEPLVQVGCVVDKENSAFFVKDNGIGVDSRYHEKVFGLFEKLDTRSEGTGVGLALVRRIIEHHGGKVWVESAGKDQGSTFYFTLSNGEPQTF